MGITPQHGETILSQMARAFLVIHSLVILAPISSSSRQHDSSRSCKYWLFSLPYAVYNMAKNKYMLLSLWKKGIA